ncbi:SoxR reducing system RseC family protein, partial [Enterobacter hormaechei subsp. steigerwaltii]|nr:SoxR reducing system RseC family protein [Enterobacter hormaechei subsp. steigerwaltii]
MIKEWATVVSWENGQALVSCDVKASCSSCASRAGCGSPLFDHCAAPNLIFSAMRFAV